VPTGRVITQARPAQTAPIPSDQIRRHPAFIEEDVLPRVADRQACPPAPSLSDDVGATLFVGVYRFF
jgi:hypothetical protein